MTDLFSILAQEQSSPDGIRPRMHAHFEESSFSPAADDEEQTLTRLSKTADQANSAAELRETEASEARLASSEMPGTATIKETMITPAEPVREDDRQVTNPAEPAQGSALALARIEFPASEGRTQEPAQAPIAPQETAEFTASAAETIIMTAATLPRPVADELETIRPAKDDHRSPDVMVRKKDHDNAAPEAAEVFPSPVSPAATAEELSAHDLAARPAEQAPNIEIHIGRIELRQAAAQIQQTPAARPRFEPPVSLSAYLERRNGGGK